jgi:glycoside/pentoside/hexuronide:cation symporter, GPH family
MPRIVAALPTASLGYAVAGGVFGIIVGSAIGFCAWRFREPSTLFARPTQGPSSSLRSALGAVLSNRPFLHLLAACASVRFGLTLLQTTLVYYAVYIMQIGHEGLPRVMGVLLLTVSLFIVFWRWMCQRWSKHHAYAAGLALSGVAVLLQFWTPLGPSSISWLLIAIIGIGMLAHWLAPYAMVPDAGAVLILLDQAVFTHANS